MCHGSRRPAPPLALFSAAMLMACTGTIGGAPAGIGELGPNVGAGGAPGGKRPGDKPGDGTPGGTGGGSGGPTLPPAESCKDERLPVMALTTRLTDRQFANSVAALFPFPVDIGGKYPRTSFGEGYTTSADANEVLFAHIQSFTETAESIALQAVGRMGQLLPCNPAGNESGCAGQFIEAFATRAFRRPVEPGERDQLVALYDGVRRAPAALDFNLGIAAVIAAVLQSPQFLYRLEIGAPTGTPGVRKLTDYDVASRLSYLYWDAPPDAALMEKARAGALGAPEAIAPEAERLLGDPRARASTWRFFSEWLGFGDQIFDSRGDRALAADFAEESRRFVLGVVLDSPEAPLRTLFDNDRTLVNRRLARHYGLPSAPASDTDWVGATLPSTMRAGVLSKAQVAVAHSPVGDTSVILRGKFVHERLLCVDLGSPPPGAVAMNPVLPDDATPRDRIDARAKMVSCNACHHLIDNVGIGMEDLDHLGRHRTRYTSGAPVDVAGKLLALDDPEPTFSGTADLARKLADHDAVAACVARQWYRYAMGRHESEREASCHVSRMAKRFTDSGHNLRELLLSVSASNAFVYRAEDATAH